jgi:hypothetical protein
MVRHHWVCDAIGDKRRVSEGRGERTGDEPDELEEDQDVLVLEWKCSKNKYPKTDRRCPKIGHVRIVSGEPIHGGRGRVRVDEEQWRVAHEVTASP